MVRVFLAALVLMLVPAASASALSAPEIFARDLDRAGAPVGDWQAIGGARLGSLNGEQLGYRLQDSGQPGNYQRVLAQVVSVPDGHPDQQDVYGLCFRKSGATGTIVPLDSFTHYEGDGSYDLKFTASIGTDAGTACATGPVTEGAFTVSTRTTITAIGSPLLNPLADKKPFAGADVTTPIGASQSHVVCARDARLNGDGSLSGSLIHETQSVPNNRYSADELYPSPGYWRCVARGESAIAPSAWSAPTPRTLVQQGYRGLYAPMRLRDRIGPVYTFTAVPYPSRLAAGATVTLTAAAPVRCLRNGTVKTRRRGSRSFHAKVDSRGRVSFRMRLATPRPGKQIVLLLSSRMTGSPLVRPATAQDIGLLLDHTGRRTVAKLILAVC
jgi:hypothetical protein